MTLHMERFNLQKLSQAEGEVSDIFDEAIEITRQNLEDQVTMNVFSDDDLKRLKRMMKTDEMWYSDLSYEDMEALLARLEAAERVCEEAERWEGNARNWEKTITKTVLLSELQVWRQSCGKAGT